MKLRVIRDGPLGGAVNMKRDTALLSAQRPGDDPVLRVYRWTPPAVSIGYNQDLAAIDQAAVRARGFDLVRRPTGGRAILHADELTYAVVGASPGPLFGDTLHATYMTINRGLLLFLSRLGIQADVSEGESREAQQSPVCFQSAGRHEVRVAGRKLIGSAQRRTGGVFLQHGSILAGPRHAELADCLGGDADPAAARRALLEATTDLGRLLGRTAADDDHRQWGALLAACMGEALGLELKIETAS
jgi:lipoate-protein ligase A